jgi:trigger factor
MTEVEDLKIQLEIEVPVTVVEKEVDSVYRRLVHQIAIPGFRRGKAPRSVVEMRLGKDVFYEEVQKDLINDAFVQAIAATDIRPINSEIIDVNLTSGNPLVFKVEIEQEPLIAIEDYKGIEVEIPKNEVGEEELAAALKDLQERYSKNVLVKDRGVETGDIVLVDFDGYDDKGERLEIVDEKNFRVEIGKGQTIPGFEDGIIGMTNGEEKDVVCTFPAEYQEESLQGKDVTFRMKLNEIKHKVVPELSDEFARELGEDYESLEDLKTQVKATLVKTANERERDQIKGAVIEKLVEKHEELVTPDSMVEGAMEKIERNLEYDLRMYRMNLDTLLESQGKTREEFREDSRPRAEMMVRADLVLFSVAKAEKITVTEEEIDAKVKEWAENFGTDAKKLKQKMLAEGTIKTLKDEIVVDKVKGILADAAVVKHVDPPAVEDEETVEGESAE